MINLNYSINKKYENSQLTLGEMLEEWKSYGINLNGTIVNVVASKENEAVSKEETLIKEKKINGIADLDSIKNYFDLKVRYVYSTLEIGNHYIDISLIKKGKAEGKVLYAIRLKDCSEHSIKSNSVISGQYECVLLKTFSNESAEREFNKYLEIYRFNRNLKITFETYLYTGNEKIASDIAINDCERIPYVK